MDFTEQNLDAISSLSIDDDKRIPSLSILLFAIVDDDDIRLIHNTLLEAGTKKGLKIEIDITKNWKEVMDMFEEKSHDIIFIDMEMPSMDLWWKDFDGKTWTWDIDEEMPIVNGVEVTKLLREMHDSLLVGISDKEREEFSEIVYSLCLQKPLTPEMVTSVLDYYYLDEDEDNEDEGEE